MAVATAKEMIEGLHDFTPIYELLDPELRQKLDEESKNGYSPETKRGRVASHEEMIKGLHDFTHHRL